MKTNQPCLCGAEDCPSCNRAARIERNYNAKRCDYDVTPAEESRIMDDYEAGIQGPDY